MRYMARQQDARKEFAHCEKSGVGGSHRTIDKVSDHNQTRSPIVNLPLPNFFRQAAWH